MGIQPLQKTAVCDERWFVVGIALVSIGGGLLPKIRRVLNLGFLAGHRGSRTRAVKYLPYAVLFLLASAPAFYLGLNNVATFTTTDENAAYMTAQMFAENGRLYYQDPVTLLDPDPPTGPRGFVQHNGRSVIKYPLGHPFVVGLAHWVFADAAPMVLAIVPGLLVLSLALLVRVLRPTAPGYLGFAFLGVIPLWYWSSRMYMDMGLSFMFAAMGLLCFAVAYTRRSLPWFFVASSAVGLAAVMRYQEAPFLMMFGGVMIIGFIRLLGPYQWNRSIRIVGIFAAAQVLWFLLPMGLLNWWAFGSPLDVGIVLAREALAPDGLPATSNAVLKAGNSLRVAIFPAPIDVGTMLRALWYQVFLMVPLVVVLGVVSVFLIRKSLTWTFGYGGSALLLLSFAYVIVSRADPNTHGATFTEPSLNMSIVRYYLPVYIALGIGAAITLCRMPKTLSMAVIIGILGWSTYQVWAAQPNSIIPLQKSVDWNSTRYRSFLENHTELDALVFTAGPVDKWLAPVRRTASAPRDSVYEPENVAATTESYYRFGTPVYYLFNSKYRKNINSLNIPLDRRLLGVQLVASTKLADLWKVVPRARGMTAEALSSTNIMVAWSDDWEREVMFELERKEGTKGAWEKIATLDGGTAFYLDEEVSHSKSFYYRVRGLDSAGKPSNWSETGGGGTRTQ